MEKQPLVIDNKFILTFDHAKNAKTGQMEWLGRFKGQTCLVRLGGRSPENSGEDWCAALGPVKEGVILTDVVSLYRRHTVKMARGARVRSSETGRRQAA
jgi:hypothetical protein